MEYRFKHNDTNIIIDDKEEVVNRIQALSGCDDVSIEKIADFCINEIGTMYYVDDKMNTFGDMSSAGGFVYLWIDSGYVKAHSNKPIFISLIRKQDAFSGHYVGDVKILTDMMKKYFAKNISFINNNLGRFMTKYEMKRLKRVRKSLNDECLPASDNVVSSYGGNISDNHVSERQGDKTGAFTPADAESDSVKSVALLQDENEVFKSLTDVTQSVWDRLLVNHWQSLYGLDYYIKICGCRLKHLIDEKKEQYYIVNNIKTAVINTGLLNQFGQDILVMYRYYMNTESYRAYKVIEGKADLVENNFTREQISRYIEPIVFLEKEDVFDAESIDDFDMNYHSLIHVLRERKERFPDLPEQYLAEKLQTAVVLGVALAKRDRNYAKPFYSCKQGNVQWFLPLHVENKFPDEPELVMVIAKRNGFYEVGTILYYDDRVKDKIRALSLYGKVW